MGPGVSSLNSSQYDLRRGSQNPVFHLDDSMADWQTGRLSGMEDKWMADEIPWDYDSGTVSVELFVFINLYVFYFF